MKVLSSIISSMKAGNIALITLAVIAAVTGALWVTLIGEAVAQGTQDVQTGAQQPGGTQQVAAGKIPESAWGWGLLAAALSTGLSAIAAGIAVAIVGSAAMGAVAERPEVMGRSIIFVGLAEGIAIYGLIISIMILGKF